MGPVLIALALWAGQPAEPPREAPAAPAAAGVAAARAETPRERRRREQAEARAAIECRDETPTGSNMPQKVCLPRSEWDRLRQDSMSDYRTLRDASPDALMRGR